MGRRVDKDYFKKLFKALHEGAPNFRCETFEISPDDGPPIECGLVVADVDGKEKPVALLLPSDLEDVLRILGEPEDDEDEDDNVEDEDQDERRQAGRAWRG